MDATPCRGYRAGLGTRAAVPLSMRSAPVPVRIVSPVQSVTASTARAQATHDEWPAEEEGSGVRKVLPTGYTRVRYVLESRTAVLELRSSVPIPHLRLAPLPDPRRIDVDDPHVDSVPARTHAVCSCPACSAPGEACRVCFGSATVEAWVSVRTTRRYAVVVHGQGPALERHTAVSEPADFDRTEFPNHLLHQAWYRSTPPQLASALRLEPQPNERIQFVQVQVFIG